jgi:hypothetical protein
MRFQIAVDGFANCRKEVVFPKLREQTESFQLVFYGVFEFGEAQFNTLGMQGGIQLADCVGRCDVFPELRRALPPRWNKQ